jgi:tetraacyldisaccharide 4'-kinase
MNKFWYSRNLISVCLFPFSLLYRVVIAARYFLYQNKIKKTTHFQIPIIVVGNITVGGTGKTPTIIWLADFLKKQGFKPGIVSRGYGGKAAYYPQIVTANSDPKIAGDEPLLLARRTQCALVVDPNRVAAAKKIVETTDCDIILSDDGLQHYALGRDIEIAIVDGARKFGNGFCLPAGPLREPIKRLKQVDFIIDDLTLVPDIFYKVINPEHTVSLEQLKNKTIHAVAGIGNPARFFQTLINLGFKVIEHPFPDHYLFTKNNFNFVKQNEIVIMTEKDAVKCEAFADEDFYCLRVKAELSTAFAQDLLKKITNLNL